MNITLVGCNQASSILQLNDLVILQPSIFVNADRTQEYCIAEKLWDGSNDSNESEIIGYVGREFLGFKLELENKLARLSKYYGDSPNQQDIKFSKERNGIYMARLLN